jgi:hypothetical protein
MRRVRTTLSLMAMPGFAAAADKDAADPAIIILLLLGLAAIIGGLGSIGDMRRKHMFPPRPRETHKHPAEQDPPSSQP